MAAEEIQSAYERHTGEVIVDTFASRGICMEHTPAVLAKNPADHFPGTPADCGLPAICP